MGICQKCLLCKNPESEIIIKKSINSYRVTSLTDPYYTIDNPKPKHNRKKESVNTIKFSVIKTQENTKRYSAVAQKKKNKIKKKEKKNELETNENNKLKKTKILNIDIEETNNEKKSELPTTQKETISSHIISNEDDYEEEDEEDEEEENEEEENEELLRKKQADDLFDTDEENVNNGQIKDIILKNSNNDKNYFGENPQENCYYYGKENGDAFLKNDYCKKNNNSNFEQELNSLNNNYLNDEKFGDFNLENNNY